MADRSAVRAATRLAAVERSRLLDTPPADAYDELTRRARRTLAAPVSLLSVVTADRQFLKSADGLPEPWATERSLPLALSVCRRVVEDAAPLVVPDAAIDPRLRRNLAVRRLGAVAYLGVPIHAPEGEIVGVLCVIDARPRAWDARDVDALSALALAAERQIALDIARSDAAATEARLRATFDAIAEGLVVEDAAGVVADANPRALALIGCSLAELRGRTAGGRDWDAIRADGSPWPVAEHPASVARTTGVAQHGVLMGLCRGPGAVRWVEVNAEPLELPPWRGRGVVMTLTDVTARRESELRDGLLAREQEGLRRVAEAIARQAEIAALATLVAREVGELAGAAAASVVRAAEDGEHVVLAAWQRPGSPSGDPTAPDDLVPTPAAGSPLTLPVVVAGTLWGAIMAEGAQAVPDAERLDRFGDLLALGVADALTRSAMHDRERRQSAVNQLATLALEEPDASAIAGEAARIVQRILDAACVRVSVLADGPPVLVASSGTSSLRGVELALGDRELATLACASGGVVVPTAGAAVPTALRGACAAALVGPVDRPWGVITAYLEGGRAPSREKARFVETIAGVLAAAVTRRRAAEAQRDQASRDPLTGLPNRAAVIERLAQALGRAPARRRGVAVLCLDLDHFKVLNESDGHSAGDALLVDLAARLTAELEPDEMVARISGDHFCVVAEAVADGEAAVARAERLRATIGAASTSGSPVCASIGAAVGGRDATAEELLRDADTALYHAKSAGRDRTVLYGEEMRTRLLRRRGLEVDLRAAVERDELELAYQPIVCLETGEVAGVEALLRWRHPRRGLLPPAAFIPIAEETGQIVPIGRWVIATACRQAASWNAARGPAAPLQMTFNLSAAQLVDDGLVAMVAQTLVETGLRPSLLGVEITESVLLGDDPARLRVLDALRALGLRLLLDDFGTGYSSLGYLRRFDLHAVKLDRAFVGGVGSAPRDTAIVVAVCGLARALGSDVVAEGVERRDQLASLQALGCAYAQGYFFARPLSTAKATRLLSGTPPWLTDERFRSDHEGGASAAA